MTRGQATQRETENMNTCAECERSYGPHYRGPCEHGGSVTGAATTRAVAILATLAWIALAACLPERTARENCPDGREWTEWCGCDPPVYGDDC